MNIDNLDNLVKHLVKKVKSQQEYLDEIYPTHWEDGDEEERGWYSESCGKCDGFEEVLRDLGYYPEGDKIED
tara:strand:+ start:11016 stop:11231 length:216 start_codon:yes stop_codon:yes gene_type:complete